MAKFCENGNEWESFVWKPRKPSCLKKDGTRDYEKLNALIKLAQEWNHEALMRVFEQYSGSWQSMCQQSDEIMYRLCMDFEDLQQEAFCCYLKTVKGFGDSKPENFKEYFITNFKNRIINILKNVEKQVVGHRNAKDKETTDAIRKFSYSVCSIQETNQDGSLKYDIPVDTENDFFIDYYPNVSKLLSKRELQIVIDYYVHGIPLKELAKTYNIDYGYIRIMLVRIKNKLKGLDK